MALNQNRHTAARHPCGAGSGVAGAFRRASPRRSRAVAAGVVLAGLLASDAESHPISVSWTQVFVTREKITVKLEIYAEDLYLFQPLEPNKDNYLEPEVINRAIEKHKKIILDGFLIYDVHGRKLRGEVVDVESFKMGPKGLHMAELMAYSLVYRLQFKLSSPPEYLTFQTALGGEDSFVPAMMQLDVRQEGAGEAKSAHLEGKMAFTVRLDWEQPAVSAVTPESRRAESLARQRKETLGITSYGSVYSFIYITDYEVRHEILIPLLTLETWTPLDRKDNAFLEVAEQDAARAGIEKFFAEGTTVEIDGIRVKPVLARLDFYGVDFKDFARQTARRRVSTVNARVGVVLSYSTKGPPDHVKITWDSFNWALCSLRSVVFAYEDTSKVELYTARPSFEWTNPGRPPLPSITQPPPPPRPPRRHLPLISLACLAVLAGTIVVMKFKGGSAKNYALAIGVLGICAAAAWPYARLAVRDPFAPQPAISDQEARAILATLHKNIYRAFDYRTESDIYDALARSVHGELLRDLYLKIQKGLKMQEQGGAISRVREVKILNGRKMPSAQTGAAGGCGFVFRCDWTVNGTVEHWGHIHSRTNQYDALFTVQACEDGWKITDLDVLSEKRVKFQTRLRTAS